MENEKIIQLKQGLTTAFINQKISSNLAYKPQFVSNNYKEGFHTKGYIFKKEEMYRIIVGSSNMTLSALTTNREWNTKIVSTEQGEYTQNVVAEFEQLWNAQQSLSFGQFIEAYTNVYTKNKIIQRQKEIAKQAEVSSLEVYRLQPNSMQVGFINNLRKIYEAGEDKALLISATGERDIFMTSERNLEFTRGSAA